MEKLTEPQGLHPEPAVALCGDCLRILDVDLLARDASDPPGRCPHCGGQTCNCFQCLDLAADLMRGCLCSPHLKAPLRSWSIRNGAEGTK